MCKEGKGTQTPEEFPVTSRGRFVSGQQRSMSRLIVSNCCSYSGLRSSTNNANSDFNSSNSGSNLFQAISMSTNMP